MLRTRRAHITMLLLALAQTCTFAQNAGGDGTLRAHMEYTATSATSYHAHDRSIHAPPAVLWLTPLDSNRNPVFADWRPRGGFQLLQKDRMFHPHLLVVPTGSTVAFPNADPFFHNVFSLFNGKRFDLGLYEAGSSKTVTFSRQGASYIFCNIHPEMSAVVLALSTPYFAVADEHNTFTITALPTGDYDLQVWVEGATDGQVAPLRRRVHITPGTQDVGALSLALAPVNPSHRNLFGEPYPKQQTPSYGP